MWALTLWNSSTFFRQKFPDAHSSKFFPVKILRHTVTGTPRYSRDLVQGGLEVPCTLIFKGEPSKIEKVKGLLKENKSKIASSEAESKDNSKEEQPVASNEVKDVEIISDQEFHSSPKRQRTDCESEWVCLGGMSLQVKDKDIIIQGEKLTDKHMNASQKLLKEQLL